MTTDVRPCIRARTHQNPWRGDMSRRCIFILPVAALLGLGVASNARADETIKYREILHALSAQSQDVGDVEGHALYVVHYSGITSFPDGSTGTGSFVALLDYIKGAGPIVVNYSNATFNDGSVLWLKLIGTAKVEGPKSLFTGTLTVTGGTGKYEGAKGDGTFSGARTV